MWLPRKPAHLALAGVVGAALVVAFFGMHHGMRFTSSEARSGAPASAYAVNSDPKPLPTVPDQTDQASNQAAEAQKGASTSPSSTAGQQEQPFEKQDSPSDPCSSKMTSAQQDYNKDVQKAKDSLDQTLSIPVGLGISSQYVTSYNTQVTGIFNKYLASAQAENCTWPVKAPATLPLTYTLH